MRVAVVGGGWAGLAAAVAAAEAGHDVTLMEASRSLGGRARALAIPQPDGTPLLLDNGQHILIGAYTACLSLMEQVGVDPQTALLRLPLALRFPDGGGLQWPDMAPPWDAVLGIARARGWSWRERFALLARAQAWQRRRFACPAEVSVATLCTGLPPRLLSEFIEPLCVAALNTPAEEASGQVFLRILRDSLFSGPGGSNLLLPRVDLGTLLPDAAGRWLRSRGAIVRTGQRVQVLAASGSSWTLDGAPFDAVVLATTSVDAARLVAQCAQAAPLPGAVALCDWAASAQALRYEAITTVYAQAPTTSVLAQPMLALRSGPAQFVFDRSQLGGPPGLLAFVASASRTERAQSEAQVLQQGARELGIEGLTCLQTVVERRATFACTPGLARPAAHIAPGLWACGDYIAGPYPATLEGAVQSGRAAAASL
ncbi:MAG: hydroxysqualene dehydroxylase HpnE [Giesbergeria sp.]